MLSPGSAARVAVVGAFGAGGVGGVENGLPPARTSAFAGHTPATVSGRYLHDTPAEVAAAVAVMTGEAHPLDASQRHSRPCTR